ncbi:hypothetical protein FA868_19285 [Escherichia coli]|nr:hypothetical protein [Escherichia coli]EFC1528612.1 hypothetical protein [Escherichia coli]EFC9528010.1 hypothetical protein [Escherichia coli]
MVSGGVGGNGPIFGHYRPLLRFSRIYRGAGALNIDDINRQAESAPAVTSVDNRYSGNNRRELLTRSPGNIPHYEEWRYHNLCTPLCVSPSRPPHNLPRNRLFALKNNAENSAVSPETTVGLSQSA